MDDAKSRDIKQVIPLFVQMDLLSQGTKDLLHNLEPRDWWLWFADPLNTHLEDRWDL